MWFLKKLDGTLYPLYTKSEHIIGRFGSLDLADDASVSRRHASITITLKDGRVKFLLKDLGSKYGTFHNGGIESATIIPKTTPIELKIGDRIKFGLQSNTWVLEESRFVTCTSNVSSREKMSTLLDIFNRLNVDIVCDWNINCTHLTMNQIKTTIKVVYAAVQAKPIVTFDYWRRLEDVFFGSVETPLPDCDEFVPLIAEPQIRSSLISLKMNKNRQILFKGFKFVMFNGDQIKKILPVVEAAGGTVIDGSSRSFQINESELCEEKVVVVENSENERSARRNRITTVLNSQNLRLINEVEIYLSIFECSTNRHCNPKYDASVSLLPPDSESFIKEEPSVLADASRNAQALQDTQFLETASGSFALEVNDRLVSSESDDDIIPGTDPSMISGTPVSTTPKRKLPIKENVTRKSARLDNWLLKKDSSINNSESLASESLFPSSASKTRKGFKDLFGFRATKKETDKSSTSLFSPNNSSLQAASASKAKENVSRTGSLFATATNKPTEAGDQKVGRTAGLFASAGGSRSTRSSSNAVPSSPEPSTSKGLSGAKRKREEVDSESKSGSRTATLFEKRVKRPTADIVVSDSDSDDGFDSNPKTSKLATVEDAPIYQDSPVDVPSKMSLSRFKNAPAKENVTHVKMEEVSPIKDTLDKSVIHYMPLVLSGTAPNIQRQSTSSSITNFKKFRKNQVSYPPTSLPNIMRLTLYSHDIENGFQND